LCILLTTWRSTAVWSKRRSDVHHRSLFRESAAWRYIVHSSNNIVGWHR
jgi:hypothetical protein